MKQFTIEMTGDKELLRELKRVAKVAPQKLEKIFFASANQTRNESIRSIQLNKGGGREYRRGNIVHLASPPGGPPNTDTGNLVSNITVQEVSGGYDVGSRGGAPYGYFLEFKEPSRGGRPWLRPAFDFGVKYMKGLIERLKI